MHNHALKPCVQSCWSSIFSKYGSSVWLSPPPSPTGCIFGSSEVAVMERAITKDRFKETKQLPNWTSCDPTQREHLRVVPTRKLLPSAPTSSYSRASLSIHSSKNWAASVDCVISMVIILLLYIVYMYCNCLCVCNNLVGGMIIITFYIITNFLLKSNWSIKIGYTCSYC